ncbi:LOW QUALITY PROTEIN: probable assembly chaperone of rpl4 [Pollicipes pollicipes]|uniref:LOW QUALITY PROTEIN: probable assembly chaperone of rpl4 n=1 Tax=Pollicipes pollicipes TaxID=41117 RepID=UPI001884DE28|nr:LOW QUALITY PROTEIN: probable assembly chaperone of rpl4 [Pollicipes pollicipes]
MGKTRKASHRGRRRPGVKAPAKMSLEQMLDAAQDELDQFRLEEARQLLNRALELQPDSVRALEMSAGLLLDIGEMEAARACLQRAVQLRPDGSATCYLSLAQLLHGREAADCYSKAVQLLSAAAATGESSSAGADGPGPARQLSSAHCALADLYMTDLCDEPDAEQCCRQHLERALDADPANPEAHQTQAGFLLVKGEAEAARAALRRSTDLWLPAYQAARAGGAAAADPLELCPLSYDLRLTAARALIECREWETATQVLDGLAEEDDQVVDTWYLLGWRRSRRAASGGRRRGLHLERARQAAEQQPDQRDPAIDEHVRRMLEELGPAPPGEDDEEDGDGEDEWTDDEEDMEVANGDG